MGIINNSKSRPHLQTEFKQYYREQYSEMFMMRNHSYGQKNPPLSKQLNTLFNITSTTITNRSRGSFFGKEKLAKQLIYETGIYPYSCVVLLLIYFDHQLLYRNGCLIDKGVVLTAASNVYDKNKQQHANLIQAVLNIDGNKGDVFDVGTDLHINQKFYEESDGSHRYNYAVLEVFEKRQSMSQTIGSAQSPRQPTQNIIKAQTSGLKHGYLGFTTSFKTKEPMQFIGYSPENSEDDEIGYYLRTFRIDSFVCRNGSLDYRMESLAEESGGPIVVKRKDYFLLVGMHISGKKDLSCGLMFSQQLRTDVNSWLSRSEGHIDLSDKQLTPAEIDKLIITPWQNMVSINLDKNSISSEGLSKLTKTSWPLLRQLHCCNNGIHKIDIQTSSIKNIQKIYLQSNHIRLIDELGQLPLLRVIKLANNKVQTINSLYDLDSLERLDLSNNKVRKIDIGIAKLCTLSKLYLSRNDIDTVSEELLKLPRLQTLYLDGNKNKIYTSIVLAKLRVSNVEVITE